MPKLTPAQDSLANRIALARVAVEDARVALADLAREASLTNRQRLAVEKQVGHLDGLGESLDLMRP